MKKRLGLFLFSVILLSSGCALRESAPIFDGAYLKYKTPFQNLTITFLKAEKGFFEVKISSDNQYFRQENLIKPLKESGKVLVDKFMKRSNGRLIELDSAIGPIWVPKNMRKKGSQEGNDMIFQGVQTDEIKEWKGMQVYAVAASVFRGAVSGEWYFDVKTGFLVGCRTETIVSDMFSSGGNEPTAILVDTNIPDLFFPGKPKKKQMSHGANSTDSTGIIIEGIMSSDNEPVVMIGGNIYHVGDVVNGVKIVEILNDRIKVFNNQEIETIQLFL